jgi:tetratricopeptide (TPR) repeat protein
LRPLPTNDGWLLVRDLAVRHILRTNEWKKPIYFAVTIPPETFAPYRDILEMEGLAYRVVPRKQKNMINVAKLERNILGDFKYTSILDDNWKRDRSVYLPPHTEHLIKNYAAAFIQLAFIQHRDSLYKEAVRNMEIAFEIAPTMSPHRELLPYYYLDAGDSASAIKFCKDLIAEDPGDAGARYRLAGVYERLGRDLESLQQLDWLFAFDRDNQDVLVASVGMALRIGQVKKAKGYLTDWLMRHPEDEMAKQYLDDLERQLADEQPNAP